MNINYLWLFFLLLFPVVWITANTVHIHQPQPVHSHNSGQEDSIVEIIASEEEEKIDVLIGGEHFTSYLYSNDFEKPVLYPVRTSDGTAITRGFPLDPRPGENTDHPHHVGLWFNYGDVNGLDFWNNSDNIPAEKKKDYGTVHHRSIDSIKDGDTQGELTVTSEWTGPDGEILLEENATFIFSGTDQKRVIDRITRLTAPDKEISLKDNKEGLLGLRLRRELEHPDDEYPEANGMYTSSEGLKGHDVWGTRGSWVNLSGQIGDENVSVAILDHPGNTGHPSYWHARGYGLFAVNPLGQAAFSDGEEELNFVLPAGESVTFRYQVIVYSGQEFSDERMNEEWEEFAEF